MDQKESLMAEKVTAMKLAECRLKGGYEIVNLTGKNKVVRIRK